MPQSTDSITYKVNTYDLHGGLPADVKHILVDSILPLLPENERNEIRSILQLPAQLQHPKKIFDKADEVFFIFLVVFAVILSYRAWKQKPVQADEPDSAHHKKSRLSFGPLVYRGCDLDFGNEEITRVLEKHQPYYKKLTAEEQRRFVRRLKKYVFTKTFVIHDKSGFREMPILISAAAIQVSFGHVSYLMPDYLYIHIHPKEYIAADNLRILAGNVQGRHISLSWKHFLNGFIYPGDGENVGLHEMAHAMYSQTFLYKYEEDRAFKKAFPGFAITANKVYAKEQNVKRGIYSDYAKINFQEFWAESVEIFFEKPAVLYEHYPELYTDMSKVLNQDMLQR
jgi:MtfA peptidase